MLVSGTCSSIIKITRSHAKLTISVAASCLQVKYCLRALFSLFLVLACHLLALDGLGQHFRATVHFPLNSAID